MGEEDIKYYYSTAHTQVFWNLEDYPIPPDFDSIYPNLRLALHRMGFHGSLGIFAYPEDPKVDINELAKANITYNSDRGEESTAAEMCLDIIDWVAANPYPRSIVVIAKKDPESEFHRVLKCLKSRNHTFFLVDPPHDTTQGSLFQSVDSIVNATQDLGGGKPRSGKPHRLPFVTPADTVANDDNDDDDDEGICCYLSE